MNVETLQIDDETFVYIINKQRFVVTTPTAVYFTVVVEGKYGELLNIQLDEIKDDPETFFPALTSALLSFLFNFEHFVSRHRFAEYYTIAEVEEFKFI